MLLQEYGDVTKVLVKMVVIFYLTSVTLKEYRCVQSEKQQKKQTFQ